MDALDAQFGGQGRGCVRLVTQEEGVKLSTDQKLAALKTILDNPLDAPEKRLVLSGLAPIPDIQALTLAAAMLDDPAVQAEAAQLRAWPGALA